MLAFPEYCIPDSEDETKPQEPVKQLIDLVVRGSTLCVDHGAQLVDLVVRDSTIRVIHDIRLNMSTWKGLAVGTLIGMFIGCILQMAVLLIRATNARLVDVKALN
jgi:hypothetical protein